MSRPERRLGALCSKVALAAAATSCQLDAPPRDAVLAQAPPTMVCGALTSRLAVRCNDGHPDELIEERQQQSVPVVPGNDATALELTRPCDLDAFDRGRAVAAALAVRCFRIDGAPATRLLQEIALEATAERACGPDQRGSGAESAGSWEGSLVLGADQSFRVTVDVEWTPEAGNRCQLAVDDGRAITLGGEARRVVDETTASSAMRFRLDCQSPLAEAHCYGQLPETAAPPSVVVGRIRLRIAAESAP